MKLIDLDLRLSRLPLGHRPSPCLLRNLSVVADHVEMNIWDDEHEQELLVDMIMNDFVLHIYCTIAGGHEEVRSLVIYNFNATK